MIIRNLPALIPLLYLAAALLVVLFGSMKKDFAYPFTLLASLVVSSLSVYGFFYVLEHGTMRYFFGGWAPPVGIEYYYDTACCICCNGNKCCGSSLLLPIPTKW
jgi:multicomponent Na+:H+ antiporter subunit D